MHDFVPEDMVNLVVEPRSIQAVFEEINHETPTLIKGAFFVLGGSEAKVISCMVYDPNREIIYKRTEHPESILNFETTVPGEYTIVFQNP